MSPSAPATITTYGAGTTQHTLSFQTPKDTVDGEGYTDTIWYYVYLREIPGGDPSWDYSDALYHVTRSTNNDGSYSYTFSLCSEYSEDDPQPTAAFTNTYTYNFIPDWYFGATITVKKVDSAGEPLAGAVFVLENSRGDAVYEAVSNSRGEASFTGVGSGEYTLLEESAPEGYVKSDQSYELSVRGSSVTMDGEAYVPRDLCKPQGCAAQPRGPLHLPRGLRRRLLRPGAEHDACRGDDHVRRLLTEQIEADKTYASSFNDVPAIHWAANCIGYMEQFGIVTGYADGSFRPDAPVTRVEFAAIASRFEKLTEGTKSFADVPPNHWAASYINFAATRGWVNGYADGTFRPENPITRAEVAAVTCRLLERTADQDYIRSHPDELRTFHDMAEGHWPTGTSWRPPTATTIRGPEAARPGSGCIRDRRPGPAATAN